MRENESCFRGDEMNNKAKILFAAHDSKIEGGANRSLISIVEGLIKTDKYDISFLVPKAQGALVDYLNDRGIKYFVYPYSWQLVSRAPKRRLLKRFKLLYLFLKDAAVGFLASLRLKKEGFDLIYTNTRVIYIGNFIDFFLKIPHIIHSREFIKEVMNRRAIFFSEKFLNKTTTRFIFISRSMLNVYDEIDREKVTVIYNGIKAPESKVGGNNDDNKINLLLTGRFGRVKGQLTAVKALSVLRKEYNTDAYLYLAGSGGEKDYNAEVEGLIDSLNLKEKVFLLGEVKNMEELRKNMTIELVCSEFEAFGRVTIEAMFSGLPVVGADAPATNEIIKNGKTGFLYDVKKPEALAEKIYMMVSNPEKTAEMADCAFKTACEMYSEEVMIKNVEAAVSETLKTNK